MIKEFPELLFLLIFLVLGGLAIVWLLEVSKLFAYLRKNYPNDYEAMGKPTMIMNNTAKTNYALLRFIYGNRSNELRDIHLATKCALLRKLARIYLVLLVGMIVMLAAVARTYF